ncbi:hypothetical protein B0H14DRAFT_3877429 [Mycena olivaceomarginata]|nr:hypothetical protein B0H14DRAFT_3877429 [Mycena olivaceomarginata]
MDNADAPAATLMPPLLSFTAATPEGSPVGTARVRAAKDSDALGPQPHALHRESRGVRAMIPTHSPPRPSSRSGIATPGPGSSRVPAPHQRSGELSRAPSRTSSLPISALVSPHAPSVARSAGGTAYHMRDPHKPPRVQPTGWALAFGDGPWWQGGGSPVHAWLFFVGFLLFPLWWVAGFCVPVPRTRRIGDDEEGREAPVVLDNPQVESDARSWRRRCRIMAGVSFVSYVPFIVLVAVFVTRSM